MNNNPGQVQLLSSLGNNYIKSEPSDFLAHETLLAAAREYLMMRSVSSSNAVIFMRNIPRKYTDLFQELSFGHLGFHSTYINYPYYLSSVRGALYDKS
ncbi:hypothetical protein ND440_17505 (plasmid) [Yersinia ruckeri]|uniref:hypothetical protein n=1 Tax=Yersinia ruckeri TaxID=29486 RepID=UPI002237845C|nr:hypothetical protein [Yersinia ruckeri]EKN4700098.1 hypothetical protein [Yersinia ruckeri]ELM3741057.1 hypothetical protein [Yersinia ruckeri]ELM3747824.1 hypothetical protein [Yersinia ruckeri]MCW6572819.1 hypothetical protein [Yersinia ruckeri]MCW6632864.1 hypothetical protein [Yersinia ruckeri]